MRTSPWIVVLALLAQASAGVSKGQNEDAEKIAIFDIEDITKEYTLEALVADANYTETEILLSNFESTTNSGVAPTSATPIYLNGTDENGRILGGTLIAAPAELVEPLNSYIFVQSSNAAAVIISSCGGVLLTSAWGLTAAHCVALATDILVVAGEIDDPAAAVGGITSAATAIIHPQFVLNFLINDIALLSLATPLAIGGVVGTAKLSLVKPTAALNNIMFRTLGFGPIDENAFLSAGSTLNFVDMRNMNKATCNAQTAPIYVLYPGNTGCLNTASGTKGICNADPGGPVFHTAPNDDVGKVIGINSQIVGCPRQQPSSFTWIFPFIPWLRAKTLKTLTS
ncbi:brachyurin-like [Cloeon dipterum]|uniref:brachyurin-like n=1 Tax=Cloeon dipterum TaxID=197152 RepID=UPI0032204066